MSNISSEISHQLSVISNKSSVMMPKRDHPCLFQDRVAAADVYLTRNSFSYLRVNPVEKTTGHHAAPSTPACSGNTRARPVLDTTKPRLVFQLVTAGPFQDHAGPERVHTKGISKNHLRKYSSS